MVSMKGERTFSNGLYKWGSGNNEEQAIQKKMFWSINSQTYQSTSNINFEFDCKNNKKTQKIQKDL